MIWYRLACLAFATPSFCEPWMTATERDLSAITIGNRDAISFLAKRTTAGFGGWIGDWSSAIALISCSIRRLTNRDHAHIPHILTHCLFHENGQRALASLVYISPASHPFAATLEEHVRVSSSIATIQKEMQSIADLSAKEASSIWTTADAGTSKCCTKTSTDISPQSFAAALDRIAVSPTAIILHQAALILGKATIQELSTKSGAAWFFTFPNIVDDYCEANYGFRIRACFIGEWPTNTDDWNKFAFKLPQIIVYGTEEYGYPEAAASIFPKIRPLFAGLAHDQPSFRFRPLRSLAKFQAIAGKPSAIAPSAPSIPSISYDHPLGWVQGLANSSVIVSSLVRGVCKAFPAHIFPARFGKYGKAIALAQINIDPCAAASAYCPAMHQQAQVSCTLPPEEDALLSRLTQDIGHGLLQSDTLFFRPLIHVTFFQLGVSQEGGSSRAPVVLHKGPLPGGDSNQSIYAEIICLPLTGDLWQDPTNFALSTIALLEHAILQIRRITPTCIPIACMFSADLYIKKPGLMRIVAYLIRTYDQKRAFCLQPIAQMPAQAMEELQRPFLPLIAITGKALAQAQAVKQAIVAAAALDELTCSAPESRILEIFEHIHHSAPLGSYIEEHDTIDSIRAAAWASPDANPLKALKAFVQYFSWQIPKDSLRTNADLMLRKFMSSLASCIWNLALLVPSASMLPALLPEDWALNYECHYDAAPQGYRVHSVIMICPAKADWQLQQEQRQAKQKLFTDQALARIYGTTAAIHCREYAEHLPVNSWWSLDSQAHYMNSLCQISELWALAQTIADGWVRHIAQTPGTGKILKIDILTYTPALLDINKCSFENELMNLPSRAFSLLNIVSALPNWERHLAKHANAQLLATPLSMHSKANIKHVPFSAPGHWVTDHEFQIGDSVGCGQIIDDALASFALGPVIKSTTEKN